MEFIYVVPYYYLKTLDLDCYEIKCLIILPTAKILTYRSYHAQS